MLRRDRPFRPAAILAAPVVTPWEFTITDAARTKVKTPTSGGMQRIIMGVEGLQSPAATGGCAYDAEYTISATACFFVKVDNDGRPPPGGDTITFEQAASFTANSQNDGTGASVAVWRLYQFTWDGTNGLISEVEDWRYVPQMNMRS